MLFGAYQTTQWNYLYELCETDLMHCRGSFKHYTFLVDYLGNINMKYYTEISLTNSLLDYKFHINFVRTLFIQNTVILSHPITRKSTRTIDLMLLLLEKKSICVSALPFVRWTGLSAARPASANPTRQPRTAKSPAPRRPHTRQR